jgi:hypothetical protein
MSCGRVSQQREAHRQWKDIVDNYTARHLTFGTDKLVAISAVARRFQIVNLESKYLAGLWSQDLAVQFLGARQDCSSSQNLPRDRQNIELLHGHGHPLMVEFLRVFLIFMESRAVYISKSTRQRRISSQTILMGQSMAGKSSFLAVSHEFSCPQW